jgi:hypothetical protein
MVRKRCPTQPPGHLLIYFSHKAVTVQGGYGVVFANPGTSFVEAGRVAVQV